MSLPLAIRMSGCVLACLDGMVIKIRPLLLSGIKSYLYLYKPAAFSSKFV